MKTIKVNNLDEIVSKCIYRRQLALSLRESGYKTKEIADIMRISRKAVWMHLTNRVKPKRFGTLLVAKPASLREI